MGQLAGRAPDFNKSCWSQFAWGLGAILLEEERREESALIFKFRQPFARRWQGTTGQPRDRKNVTVQLSYDEGKSWSAKRTVDAGYSGYAIWLSRPTGPSYCFMKGLLREQSSLSQWR